VQINLLSLLFNWLATHLVAFTLLGFMIAGLCVSGAIDVPWVPATKATEVATTGTRPSPAGGERPEAAALAPEQEVPGSSSVMLGPAASGILSKADPVGGGLPVHGTGDPEKDFFRPPDDVQQPDNEAWEDDLQRARRAFWNGDFEASEAAYMALILAHPGDGNAFGELGNLYQSMNRPERALDAYYEAGIRFKAAEKNEKLNEIIEVLKQYGDERAHELTP